jgi:hypothetical protein
MEEERGHLEVAKENLMLKIRCDLGSEINSIFTLFIKVNIIQNLELSKDSTLE